ncbi:hypothetical protein ACFE04_030431 [Oxalis oulophora]
MILLQRSLLLLSSSSNPIHNTHNILTSPITSSSSSSSLSLCSVATRSRIGLSPISRQNIAISPVQTTATREIVETAENDSVTVDDGRNFIETGYISNTHGIQGEVCIRPNTDFPDLRFGEPGIRWLKQQVNGKDVIQEVELVEGRSHPGQSSWILRFEGIDTPEKAKLLVGSTLLVRDEDRPELDEGEFYSRDLIGMRVIMQETGELVGTVKNVFDNGGSDLLHVMLNSSTITHEQRKETKPDESGPLVWIPFVEAIVPIVDMNKREMQITPPEGLLELNIRSNEKSKKERRQLEWAERKRFQRRLIAAKKKLSELEQQHVFNGFKFGGKPQGKLLGEQIVGVNSKLLQQALLSVQTHSERSDIKQLVNAAKNKMEISTEKLDANSSIQKRGLKLISKGKFATVLVVERQESESLSFEHLHSILSGEESFVKIEDRVNMPLVLVCPAHTIEDLETDFADNDYFAFDSEKVWFLEEEKLPVVNSLPQEQNKPKILMKSPWEILQKPIGSGGVFSLLSSNNISEKLIEMGVAYIQICSTSQTYHSGNPLFLGFVNSVRADIGLKISNDVEEFEGNFNMIFSMNIMKNLTNQSAKLQFSAIPSANSHVELVEKEWVDINPSSPNSFELCCWIHNCINACSPDKVCVMQITK